MLLYGNLPRFLCQQSATGCTACLEKRAAKNSSFSLEICAQKMVRLPWKTCHKLLYGFCLGNRAKSALNCVQTLLYGLAEIWPWNVCQGAASFSSLLRNLPCSLALLLPICSWKNEWTFPSFSSFNLTLSDFWGIPKSNGWNRLRSRAEIKCSFKSHFLFFNSPHFNKNPLSHLFRKSLFLSNFTLTLLKSL